MDWKIIRFAVILCVCNHVICLEWYEGANFYQIYPRSFMDSNGDGVGDLPGIQSKLQYLKDLGIDGVWLSPIYKSPMADFGYDISDFRDIHDEFGTMDDFDSLLAECNKLGLKLVLDFVPNHSSDEHEWFQKSENREPGYEDYYIWRAPKFDENTNIAVPPNNWLSGFRFSSWRWSEIRQEMYYHFFHYKQADLNYRNPKVVQEMKDVLTYWLDKGVSGFRVDAVPTMFEKMNEDGSFPDEPRSFNNGCDRYDHCYLDNIYTENQKENYDMIYQWRKLLDDLWKTKGGHPFVMMTESYEKMETNMKYYTNGTVQGSHVPFNFELIKVANVNTTAEQYKNIIEGWLNAMPAGHQANWVLGNHDNHRMATRLGVERGDLLNIMLQTLPGIAITYQGEELVMTNVNISWADTLDPSACNTNPQVFNKKSRDPARTPFPWDDTKNAGFSTANKTWLPVGTEYLTVNVKAQEAATNSHLKIFKKLTKIRKEPMFRSGSYQGVLSNNKSMYIYRRQYSTNIAIILLNFANTEQTVDLIELFPFIPEQLKIYTSSLNSGLTDDDLVNSYNVVVKGNIGLVLLSGTGRVVINIYLVIMSCLVYLK
ncbi:unnamed protein product [Diamesa serratosioi]